MEKILKIALDAEQKAQNIIAQAMKEKAVCYQNIANADNIKDEYIEIAKSHIREFEESEKLNTQTQCEELDRQLEQNIQKLEQLYNTHGGQWVDEMYRQITEKL